MQTRVVSQQCAELQRWSGLSTVTRFDAGSTLPIGMADNSMALQDINNLSAVSLLIQSLVEQLCNLLESSPRQQKVLYKVICQKLHQMNFIDQSYSVEEFEFIRSHYQGALFHLLSVAKSVSPISENETNILLPLPRYNLGMLDALFKRHLSHYNTKYEELEYIAHGGFGRVYKARNKLDGIVYAIKKICLRYRNINGFLISLREVKMLAKLNHPNIVSYKTAWLEPIAVTINSQVAKEDGSDKSDNVTSDSDQAAAGRKCYHHSTEDDSGSIVFKNSKSRDRKGLSDSSMSDSINRRNADKNNKEARISECTENVGVVMQQKEMGRTTQSYKNEGCINDHLDEISAATLATKNRVLKHMTRNKTSHEFTSSTDDSNTSADKMMTNYKKSKQIANLIHCDSAMLYVQMQLCESTLRQWLDKRNSQESCVVDVKQSIAIFQQIVSGVCYIHSQSIVHHDIKPGNIFVNHDLSQVQVGDFGLACCLQHSLEDVTLMVHPSSKHPLKHKGEVGTKLYAAPEQLSGKCDQKSDLYSLGIVLFELMQHFTTNMERSKLITKLRSSGHIPSELALTTPKLAQLIGHLMSASPSDRPCASELQSILVPLIKEANDITASEDIKSRTIQNLRSVIKKKDHENEELRHKLEELRQQLEELQKLAARCTPRD